jgi:hypothetical protein
VKRGGISLIPSGTPPWLTAQQSASSTNVTGWTTDLFAGDIVEFNLNSVSTIKRINLQLQVTRT